MEELNKHFTVVDVTHQPSSTTITSSTIAVLADHIKTLLMVPDSEYYPEVGHKILAHYTNDEIVQCFHEMKRHGWLATVKDKNQLRSYKLSQKYTIHIERREQ
jgi:hypothetical protein